MIICNLKINVRFHIYLKEKGRGKILRFHISLLLLFLRNYFEDFRISKKCTSIPLNIR